MQSRGSSGKGKQSGILQLAEMDRTLIDAFKEGDNRKDEARKKGYELYEKKYRTQVKEIEKGIHQAIMDGALEELPAPGTEARCEAAAKRFQAFKKQEFAIECKFYEEYLPIWSPPKRSRWKSTELFLPVRSLLPLRGRGTELSPSAFCAAQKRGRRFRPKNLFAAAVLTTGAEPFFCRETAQTDWERPTADYRTARQSAFHLAPRHCAALRLFETNHAPAFRIVL